MKNTYSHSSISCYLDCPKKYYFQYLRGWESKAFPKALVYGNFVHALQHMERLEFDNLVNQYADTYPDHVLEVGRQARLAIGTAEAHQFYWRNSEVMLGNLNFLEREKRFSFKVNGEEFTGIRDGYVEYDGRKYLYELKTASSIGKEQYLARLELDQQINIYLHSLDRDNLECDGVIYDVIWKPAIRQKKSETEEEFDQRYIDELGSDPGKYFHREIVIRDQENIKKDILDLSYVVGRIDNDKKTRTFVRNSGACNRFNSLCSYFLPCMDRNREDQYESNFMQRKEIK